jgi:hypothetical protein
MQYTTLSGTNVRTIFTCAHAPTQETENIYMIVNPEEPPFPFSFLFKTVDAATYFRGIPFVLEAKVSYQVF